LALLSSLTSRSSSLTPGSVRGRDTRTLPGIDHGLLHTAAHRV
jgi:hypothetical protein